MKKLFVLSAALMVLLLSFATNKEVSVAENSGIQVCEDLMPSGNTFD